MNISIDIGTSFTSACVLDESGKAIPVALGQENNSFSIPSAVFLEESGKLQIGQIALNSRLKNPQYFQDKFKQDLGKSAPYYIGGKNIYPQDIYTEFFSHITNVIHNKYGSIDTVYITHPATFSQKQKDLLVKSANQASIFRLSLIDEPTAAAMFYTAKNAVKEDGILLVYDFGGGTFDVSVGQYKDGAFTLLTLPQGLAHCGGINIDEAIWQDVASKIGSQFPNQMDDMRRYRLESQIVEMAVRAKLHLTCEDTFSGGIDTGKAFLDYDLTRSEFHGLIAMLIDQTISCTDALLKSASLEVSDLSAVAMVGGTSKIPLVQEMVQTYAKGIPLLTDADMELAVVKGALYHQDTPSEEQLDKWNAMGRQYYKGDDGIPPDYTQAVYWFQKAAKHGRINAQHNLANCYLLGQGLSKDETVAFEMFTSLAEQGDSNSQYVLGTLYEKGIATQQDSDVAYQWYQKAAEQGHPGAIKKLPTGTSDTFTMSGKILTKYTGDSIRLVLPRDIQEIGAHAFADCTSLEQIIIPSHVSSIGVGAFKNCSKLRTITIPDNVSILREETFKNCKSLSRVIFHDKLHTIERQAFHSCQALQKISLPSSITTLGDAVFCACINLCDVTLSQGLVNFGDSVFDGCTNLTTVTLPASVRTIGGGLFQGCTCLESVEIPDAVTTLKSFRMFYGCINLKQVKLPDSIDSIGTAAFYQCESLVDIHLPDSLIDIAAQAFQKCKSLCHITLPDSVCTIGKEAFRDCTSLKTIRIPESVTCIETLFQDCVSLEEVTLPNEIIAMAGDVFHGCTSLTGITLPRGITKIGDGEMTGTFVGCSSLTQVILPDTLTSIGENMYRQLFQGCTALTHLSIPESVMSIGSHAFVCADFSSIALSKNLKTIPPYAFSNCSKLTHIDLPSGVTTIGNDAFCRCAKLQAITIPPEVTQLYGSTFLDCISLQEVTLPPKLTFLGGIFFGVFKGCVELKILRLPDHITKIESAVFANCPKLNLICRKNTTTAKTLETISQSLFKGSLKGRPIIYES